MKITVVTINDMNNYGNRLQNYALVYYINKYITKNCFSFFNQSFFKKIKKILKLFIPLKKYRRVNNFNRFNRLIPFTQNRFGSDVIIVGSDQVWNYTLWKKSTFDNQLVYYFPYMTESNRILSYAASFGIDFIDEKIKKIYVERFKSFLYLSVRENSGKNIIEELTKRNDVEVLIDPTMLLSEEEWINVSKKPKKFKDDKYILNYFLGDISYQRLNAINDFALKHNFYIINLLDKNSPFYACGPSEFLYLEKHAEMIFTDSFHSSVFAFLFDRPFVVFDREQEGIENMGSRLDTLLNKFQIENRRFNGIEITKENYEHNYSIGFEILQIEREKSKSFLEKALNINIC